MSEKTSDRRVFLVWGLFFSLIGLVLYALILAWGGQETRTRLRELTTLEYGAYLACIFLLTSISALRWGMLTNLLAGRKVCSYERYYLYFVLSRCLGEIILPQSFSDLVLRPMLVGMNRDASAIHTTSGAFADRLIDVILLTITMIPALIYSFGWISSAGYWALLLLLFGCWAILSAGFIPWLWRGLDRVLAFGQRGENSKWPVMRKIGKRLTQARAEVAMMADTPNVFRILNGLSVIRYLLIGFQLYLIAYFFRIDLTVTEIMVSMPLAQLVSVLAITPGAVGFREGGLISAFALMHVSGESVRAFVPLQRLMFSSATIALTVLVLANQGSRIIWRRYREKRSS